MSAAASPGLFSTLRPFGLPPTPIIGIILTYGINVVATPRMYYGDLLQGGNNVDPASLLLRAQTEKGVVSHEQRVKITRAQGAAANLAECIPLYIVASLVGWLGGVKPEYQNAFHIVWFLGRASYKWAYLTGRGYTRTLLYWTAQLANYTMLIHGGNLLAEKTALLSE